MQIAFRTAKIGQHLGIRPALVALRRPAVEDFGRASAVTHAVDRTAAAQYLSAHLRQDAIVEMFLRRGLVVPAEQTLSQRWQKAARHMDEQAAIFSARFKQQ